MNFFFGHGVVLEFPPFLVRVNILCDLASVIEGLDSSCKEDLSNVSMMFLDVGD